MRGIAIVYSSFFTLFAGTCILACVTAGVSESAHAADYSATIDSMFTDVTFIPDPVVSIGQFGTSVAFSADGTHALVGAPDTSQGGAAYLFAETGGVWNPTPIATFSDPRAANGDQFGQAVALSADGTTALVGDTGNGLLYGAAYVFTSTQEVWSTIPAATIADPVSVGPSRGFGVDVSLSGDGATAAVGTHGAAVYLFAAANGVWPATPTVTFTDPNLSGIDEFGFRVAISGDGKTLVVGAYADNNNLFGEDGGVAYVYTKSGLTWSTTPAASFADPGMLAGNDNFEFDSFGGAVAVSSDGATILVGADGTTTSIFGAGTAYIYTATGGIWPATPTALFTDPGNGFADAFGYSVALSSNGTVALIGAYGTANRAGAAYAYASANGVWSSNPVTAFTEPLATKTVDDYYGLSVALSGDGISALVGSPFRANGRLSNAGAAYIMTSPVDLSIVMSAEKGGPTLSPDTTFTMTVKNDDPMVAASGVTLTDVLPQGSRLVATAGAGGRCAQQTGIVTCRLSALAPMASWQPALTVRVTKPGILLNTATVAGNQPDWIPSNDIASARCSVIPWPVLHISKCGF